jgi:hypothetical protein
MLFLFYFNTIYLSIHGLCAISIYFIQEIIYKSRMKIYISIDGNKKSNTNAMLYIKSDK